MSNKSIIGEPEVLEHTDLATHPAWLALKAAAVELQPMQSQNGAIEDAANTAAPANSSTPSAPRSRPSSTSSRTTPTTCARSTTDFERWADGGFGVPDFLDSLVAFQPQQHRVDGLRHLVVFPMYTQNGSTDRLRRGRADRGASGRSSSPRSRPATTRTRCSCRSGSSTSRPATTPTRRCCSPRPSRCARSRRSPGARSSPTARPPGSAGRARGRRDHEARAARRTPRACSTTSSWPSETFVMWDLIHDRTHMRGDLPFDPFMIKQRMPYFLYSLEELRCDLTAFREAVKLVRARRHG